VIDDAPKALLAGLLAAVVVVVAWVRIVGGPAATAVARRFVDPPGRRVLFLLLAFVIFAAVADDAVEGRSQQLLSQLDQQARALLRAEAPPVIWTAKLIGRLTGSWLPLAIAVVVAVLAARRRLGDAAVIVLGALTAWGMAGLLKVTFGVPRPRARLLADGWTSFGFPSGHAVVTVVAAGLVAWAFTRRSAPRVRAAAALIAAGVAAVAGLSRVVVDAHWFSDVLGGFAFGVVWLNLVVLVAERPVLLNRLAHAFRRAPAAVPVPPGPGLRSGRGSEASDAG